jgi:hypothetical protein
MSTLESQAYLDQIESQLDEFSKALVDFQSDSLVVASTALQTISIAFSKFMQQRPDLRADPGLHLRVRKIAAALAVRRESLFRHAVIVERSLAALVPSSQSNTYAPSSGLNVRQAYGSAGRQSGEFRSLSA